MRFDPVERLQGVPTWWLVPAVDMASFGFRKCVPENSETKNRKPKGPNASWEAEVRDNEVVGESPDLTEGS